MGLPSPETGPSVPGKEGPPKEEGPELVGEVSGPSEGVRAQKYKSQSHLNRAQGQRYTKAHGRLKERARARVNEQAQGRLNLSRTNRSQTPSQTAEAQV